MPDAPPIHSVVARPATPTSLPVSSSSPQVLPPFSRVTCLDILDHHIAVWNTYFVQPTDIPTLSALDLQQALLALAAACGVRKKRLQEWLNQGRKLRRIIGEGAEVEEESGWAWLVLFDFTSLVLDKISLESLTDYVMESWRGVVEKEGARLLAEAEGLVRGRRLLTMVCRDNALEAATQNECHSLPKACLSILLQPSHMLESAAKLPSH